MVERVLADEWPAKHEQIGDTKRADRTDIAKSLTAGDVPKAVSICLR